MYVLVEKWGNLPYTCINRLLATIHVPLYSLDVVILIGPE